MKNNLKPEKAKIIEIKDLSPTTKLFRLELKHHGFIPGQFMLLSVLGLGEAPFGYASDSEEKDFIEIGVRKAGSLTNFVYMAKVGDEVGIRGPYGNGFPMAVIDQRPVLILAGGCGFLLFRPLIYYLKKKQRKDVQIFYGSREVSELLFNDQYDEWASDFNLNLTVDKKEKDFKGRAWGCESGLITNLLGKNKLIDNAIAIICGPPVMAKFVIEELKKKNYQDEDIYVSLERRMDCAFGVCQHCVVGPYYVCKDGPLFTMAQLRSIPGAI